MDKSRRVAGRELQPHLDAPVEAHEHEELTNVAVTQGVGLDTKQRQGPLCTCAHVRAASQRHAQAKREQGCWTATYIVAPCTHQHDPEEVDN